MNNTSIEKISKFFSPNFLNKLSNIAIVRNEDNTYELFNKYYIIKDNNGFKLVNHLNSDVKYFGSLKNAVIYCIFENKNKFVNANRIEFLDKILSSTEFNIQAHKHLIKKTKDQEYRLIYAAKLTEEETKKKLVLSELSTYVTQSKKFVTK